MGWTWRCEDAGGDEVSPLPDSASTETFAAKADAEAWLGDSFQTLLDAGIDQVSLLEDGVVAYTMSLHPADE